MGKGNYRIKAQVLFPVIQGKILYLGSSSPLHLQVTGVKLTPYLDPRYSEAASSPSWPSRLYHQSAVTEPYCVLGDGEAGQWGCNSEKSFRDGWACDLVVGTQAGP